MAKGSGTLSGEERPTRRGKESEGEKVKRGREERTVEERQCHPLIARVVVPSRNRSLT